MSAATTEELFHRASAGDRDALLQYAMRLMDGIDCERNPQAGAQCLERAAEMGSGEAAMQLGVCYAYGIGLRQDDENSTRCFRRGAELGDPESMFRLFLNLSLGIGCGVNPEEADAWLAKSKDCGSARAAATWGDLNSSGMMNASLNQEKPGGKELRSCRELKESTALAIDRMVSPSEACQAASGEEVGEIELVSQNYSQTAGSATSIIVFLVYLTAGLFSGLAALAGVENGVSILNSDAVYSEASNYELLVVFFIVLGLVVGLIMALLVKLMYKKSPMSILFFLPTLVLPLILLCIASPAMAITIFIGKLLYGLLTLAVGLLGVYCVCASSSS